MAERTDEAVAQPEAVAPPAPVPAGPAPAPAPPSSAAAVAGLGQRFTGADSHFAQGMVRDLGRRFGNAAVARSLAPARRPTGVQERVESVTGYDLSEATVHESSSAAAGLGVDGLAVGSDVHLAPGVSPDTAQGEHVLAHELAHVVQQRTGRSAGLDVDGRRGALEADAETVAGEAARATSAAPVLAPLPPPRELALQLFDPRYHRTSVVQGLEGSGFTPDEIGAIYAANWERDLSQAHPGLGNVILAWKSVKVAAYEGRLTEADIAGFQGACQSVLEQALAGFAQTRSFDGFLNATAYGGYQFYEHMDNPAGTPQAAQMKVVLGGKNTSGLPDHIYISREYIKEMLFEAAKLSHPDLAGTPSSAVAASSADTRAKLGAGPGTPTAGGLPAAPVASETSHEVQGKHPGTPGGGAPLDPRAYEMIGRASHALEDFWSHSNFVERAIGDPDFQLGGLTTATFGDDDKTHALAHKIRGAADEIEAEMPLVDRMASRRRSDPAPGEVNVGDETPVHHEDDVDDLMGAVGQLGDVVGKLPENVLRGFGRGYDRGMAAGGGGPLGIVLGVLSGAEGAVVGGLASVMGSRAGVFALRQLAEKLDEDTQKKQEATGDYQAHGLLAKDQPGHEDDVAGKLKTAKFELAHALSVAADRMVTAKMKSVIDAANGADADARLREIFTDLDALIGDAAPGHPLWGIVESHRAEAEAALNAYLASKPGAGDLAPSTPPTAVPV
jgi:hypothetical protein